MKIVQARADVALVTPTGSRHLAFALLEKWIAAQDFTGTAQWIVVDDGHASTRTTLGQSVVRQQPMRGASLGRNLKAAVEVIDADIVLIIEDDDYYAPSYVRKMAGYLQDADLAGLAPSIYYNIVSRRFFNCDNRKHASLCVTSFRRLIVPWLKHACDAASARSMPFVDMILWALTSRAVRKRLERADPDKPLSIGMKGMPGRKGLGGGHNSTATDSPGWKQIGHNLRSWIGADAAVYDALTSFIEANGVQAVEAAALCAANSGSTADVIERVRSELMGGRL